MKFIVVFYHKDCLDGFGAAWAAWKKFGNKANYIGLDPRKPILSKIKNKEIYFLDVCVGKSEFQKLVRENRRVILIDHHASRKGLVNLASESGFSLVNSASVLAWRYFYPKKLIPQLLRVIEDYDLWRFRLPGTKELNAVLKTIDFNFKLWDRIMRDFESIKKRKKYLDKGHSILRAMRKIVEDLVSVSPEVAFQGKRAIAVNSPILESEIGHYIYEEKKFPIGIIWSFQSGMIRVGLRSGKNIDVSKIAQKFGGGGHKQAAGFSLKPSIKLPWRLIK